MDSPDSSVTVYTDGACRGNPGRGGWAWAVPDGPYASGADPATTNQRMEIRAALEAVRYWRTQPISSILVVSDSTYVVNCFKDRWWQGWQKRNWLNSQKKPVANRDLWEPLIELALESAPAAPVSWRWVKGHSGDRWNDRVDELATVAADRGRGESYLPAGSGAGAGGGSGRGSGSGAGVGDAGESRLAASERSLDAGGLSGPGQSRLFN